MARDRLGADDGDGHGVIAPTPPTQRDPEVLIDCLDFAGVDEPALSGGPFVGDQRRLHIFTHFASALLELFGNSHVGTAINLGLG